MKENLKDDLGICNLNIGSEELKSKSDNETFGKKALYVFECAASLILIIFLCIMMYKNNFSMESLLSLLLAFFSIFISIFFYFKASDTSNKFYDNSYFFMKDISVTLGKIEERFGEKLNNINEKISQVTVRKEETSEELKTVEDEKQAIIDDLLEKSKLDKEEKEKFRLLLRKKQKEVDCLERQVSDLDKEKERLNRMKYRDIESISSYSELSKESLLEVLRYLDINDIMILKEGRVSPSVITAFKNIGFNIVNTSSAMKMQIYNRLIELCR